MTTTNSSRTRSSASPKRTVGKPSRDDGYIHGAPEFVAEVAEQASYDLHQKKAVYLAHGVREYLVWSVEDSGSTGGSGG